MRPDSERCNLSSSTSSSPSPSSSSTLSSASSSASSSRRQRRRKNLNPTLHIIDSNEDEPENNQHHSHHSSSDDSQRRLNDGENEIEEETVEEEPEDGPEDEDIEADGLTGTTLAEDRAREEENLNNILRQELRSRRRDASKKSPGTTSAAALLGTATASDLKSNESKNVEPTSMLSPSVSSLMMMTAPSPLCGTLPSPLVKLGNNRLTPPIEGSTRSDEGYHSNGCHDELTPPEDSSDSDSENNYVLDFSVKSGSGRLQDKEKERFEVSLKRN